PPTRLRRRPTVRISPRPPRTPSDRRASPRDDRPWPWLASNRAGARAAIRDLCRLPCCDVHVALLALRLPCAGCTTASLRRRWQNLGAPVGRRRASPGARRASEPWSARHTACVRTGTAHLHRRSCAPTLGVTRRP